MTSWNRAWKHRNKTRLAAKARRWLKRQNHRLNRRLGSALEADRARLNGRDVI